jgi:hypothetical protein
MINGIMRKLPSTVLFLLIYLLVAGLPGLARAANPLYSAVGFNDGNYNITFAMEFTPLADIRVTHLGVLDAGLDGPGLQASHDVALWQNDGTLVASSTINPIEPITSEFRYVSITPVTLTAGQTYVLGAHYPTSIAGDKLVASASPTASPFVTIAAGTRYAIGPSLAFPTSTNPDFRIAANLLFNPVDTSRINIDGTVKDGNGVDVCAMVLASGKYKFSCNPVGIYSLSSLPRRTDGTVKLQAYADGFLPYTDTVIASGTKPITLTPAGTCPNYNPPGNPGVYPGSAGKKIDISGSVFTGADQTPVCAMVLASGKYMFSCGANLGIYNLRIPLNSNGQFKLQIYADGYAPYTVFLDEFQNINNIQLTPASECQ